MSQFAWIMLFSLGWWPASLILSRHISPRALTGLAKMIKVKTGREALEYNWYGNYCGFGGAGQPVDDTDNCCKMHDDCYDTLLQQSGCVPYFIGYKVNYDGFNITCVENGDYCSSGACTCDSEAANCFSRVSFNPSNKRLRMLRDF
ncbi:hypothetical protein CHUAL_008302 [Chamberlinius hualienensis]